MYLDVCINANKYESSYVYIYISTCIYIYICIYTYLFFYKLYIWGLGLSVRVPHLRDGLGLRVEGLVLEGLSSHSFLFQAFCECTVIMTITITLIWALFLPLLYTFTRISTITTLGRQRTKNS